MRTYIVASKGRLETLHGCKLAIFLDNSAALLSSKNVAEAACDKVYFSSLCATCHRKPKLELVGVIEGSRTPVFHSEYECGSVSSVSKDKIRATVELSDGQACENVDEVAVATACESIEGRYRNGTAKRAEAMVREGSSAGERDAGSEMGVGRKGR